MTPPTVRAVFTASGVWVHLAVVDTSGDAPRKLLTTGRTVCGAKVDLVANPGGPSCHRCARWARAHGVTSVQDSDGAVFSFGPPAPPKEIHE